MTGAGLHTTPNSVEFTTGDSTGTVAKVRLDHAGATINVSLSGAGEVSGFITTGDARRMAQALTEAADRIEQRSPRGAVECDRGSCHRPATASGTQGFRWCDEHLPRTNAEIVEARPKSEPQALPRCDATDPDEGACIYTPHDPAIPHWFSRFALGPVEPPAPEARGAMSPEQIRAAAAAAVWQVGAVSSASRQRDIDDVAQYIATGEWAERR